MSLCTDYTYGSEYILAHEAGHNLFSLCDEYADLGPAGTESRCPQSAMAGFGPVQRWQLCTDLGHGRDSPWPSWGVAPTCGGTTTVTTGAWRGLELLGIPPHPADSSPDGVDFRFHDFNDALAMEVY
jgi:hypothetical protein